MRHHTRHGAVALILAMMLAFAGCIAEDDTFEPVANGDTPADTVTGDAGDTVELHILEGAGGSVVVFVPVYIQGEGPFDFVLDTGASRTVIDEAVSAQFEFPELESVGDVTGVGGTAEANLVEVQDWRLGETIELPAMQVTTFPVFEDQEAAAIEGQMGREVQGLLGSDVLAHFGVITVDFENSRLIIGR